MLHRVHHQAVLQPIFDAAAASRRILEWPDDWDGEGSPRYQPVTWERAVEFIERNAVELWEEQRAIMEIPEVLPGPSGSIDVRWRVDGREFLITIPQETSALARFYGRGQGDFEIEGTIRLDSPESSWLLSWITT